MQWQAANVRVTCMICQVLDVDQYHFVFTHKCSGSDACKKQRAKALAQQGLLANDRDFVQRRDGMLTVVMLGGITVTPVPQYQTQKRLLKRLAGLAHRDAKPPTGWNVMYDNPMSLYSYNDVTALEVDDTITISCVSPLGGNISMSCANALPTMLSGYNRHIIKLHGLQASHSRLFAQEGAEGEDALPD